MDKTQNPEQSPVRPAGAANATPLIAAIVLTAIASGAVAFFVARYVVPPQLSEVVIQEPEAESELPPEEIPDTPDSKATLPAAPTIAGTKRQWAETDVLGAVTFEYPYGWHVAAIWPESGREGISVWIDSRPINTAPRGGSLDDVHVNVLNGVPDPEAQLEKKKKDFSQGLENKKESQIQSPAGGVAVISGTANIMEEKAAVTGYFLLVPSSDPSDKFNYQVISSSIGTGSENADELRHIMESVTRASY